MFHYCMWAKQQELAPRLGNLRQLSISLAASCGSAGRVHSTTYCLMGSLPEMASACPWRPPVHALIQPNTA